MFDPSPWHITILVIVLVLLFGAKRLPGAARSLGQSLHIFKQSVQGSDPETFGQDSSANSYSTLPPPAAQPAVTPPAPEKTEQQLADLQRQVQELQRQSAGANGGDPAEAAQRSETQTSQPL